MREDVSGLTFFVKIQKYVKPLPFSVSYTHNTHCKDENLPVILHRLIITTNS